MTCQEIYDITMALMDEMLDNGGVDYASTLDYTARTPGILTILQTEVVMTFKAKGIDIDTLDRLTAMTDDVDLDENICMGVLPYGLAARLLGQEDKEMSSYFSQQYNLKLEDAADSSDDRIKGKQVSGDNVYGLFEAGD